jgi:hypothetical protein
LVISTALAENEHGLAALAKIANHQPANQDFTIDRSLPHTPN